jgi:serine/threonine protein kinase
VVPAAARVKAPASPASLQVRHQKAAPVPKAKALPPKKPAPAADPEATAEFTTGGSPKTPAAPPPKASPPKKKAVPPPADAPGAAEMQPEAKAPPAPRKSAPTPKKKAAAPVEDAGATSAFLEQPDAKAPPARRESAPPKKKAPSPAQDPEATGVLEQAEAPPPPRKPPVPRKKPPAPPADPETTEPDAEGEDANATSAFQMQAEDAEATGAFDEDVDDEEDASTEDEAAEDDASAAEEEEAEEAGATGAYTEAEEDPSTTTAHQEQATQGEATGEFEDSEEDKPGPKTKSRSGPKDEMPDRLGGYVVLKELGRGGMGSVYLGRQLSLDRRVALKVMNPKWASDAGFVARFTREAYAAAQLSHHNVVQIYDLGLDHKTHFFAMEFVPGKSLGDLLKKEGRLAPEVAVGYVLQAARGLKFGHDMGMIHRDVKPDNLMLSEQGVVKVADLGLVKVPGLDDEEGEGTGQCKAPKSLVGPADVTRAGVALGTPSYMAPEQARDAAHVDPRADIYSLGCTLYAMLTGKPPFTGKTVNEVLTKHATAPVVPPEVIVKNVPRELSAVLIKMMAKKPEQRYGDLGEVIGALESFLDISSDTGFEVTEEHLAALEYSVQKYSAAPLARVRSLLFVGLFGVCGLFGLLALLVGGLSLSAGLASLAVATALTYFVAQGLSDRPYLFLKVREFVLGARPGDWAAWLGGTAVLIVILWLLGLLWWCIGFGIAGLLVGLGFYFGLDWMVARQREPAVEQAEKLLKRMRLQGMEEEALRQFVCKNSGKNWEAFFEELFGYEAKLAARTWLYAEGEGSGRKSGAWRDPLVRWIESRQATAGGTRAPAAAKARRKGPQSQGDQRCQGAGAGRTGCRRDGYPGRRGEKAAQTDSRRGRGSARGENAQPDEGRSKTARASPSR